MNLCCVSQNHYYCVWMTSPLFNLDSESVIGTIYNPPWVQSSIRWWTQSEYPNSGKSECHVTMKSSWQNLGQHLTLNVINCHSFYAQVNKFASAFRNSFPCWKRRSVNFFKLTCRILKSKDIAKGQLCFQMCPGQKLKYLCYFTISL